MPFRRSIVVIVAWCVAAGAQSANEDKKSSHELNGFWHLLSQENNPPPRTRDWRFAIHPAIFFEGDEYFPAAKDGSIAGSAMGVRIDASKTPKALDFKAGMNTWLCIYKLEGDVLTVATQMSTDKRPDTFETNVAAGPGRAYRVMVYKRVVESAEAAAARIVGRLDPKTQMLDGLWEFTDSDASLARTGEQFPERDQALFFDGKNWSGVNKNGWHGADRLNGYVANPNAEPPTIDFKFANGRGRPANPESASFAAIYKIDGDELWIALNALGSGRPKTFSTKVTAGPGRANELRKYRRIHPSPEIARAMQPTKLDPSTQALRGFWVVDQMRAAEPERFVDLHPILRGYKSFERELAAAKEKGSVEKAFLDRMREFEKNATAAKDGQLRLLDAVAFDDNKWISAAKNGTPLKNETYSFKADVAQPFPTIELRMHNRVLAGIYKIEGDRLFFATNFDAQALPKSFTTNLSAGAARAHGTVVFVRRDLGRMCVESPARPLLAEFTNPTPKAAAASELNGFWVLDKSIENLPPRPTNDQPRFPPEVAIAIDNDRCYYADARGRISRARPLAIKVDPTTNPKTIDYRVGQQIWRSIYQLEGDTLTIATQFSPDVRPDTFATSVASGPGRAYHLRIYRRINETLEQAQRKVAAKLDPQAQNIDGFWILEDDEDNSALGDAGPPFGRESAYFEGDRWYSAKKDGSLNKTLPVPFQANPLAAPPTLDYFVNGHLVHAIYKIENDRLTIASGAADSARPQWFTVQLAAGVGRADSLRVFKRVAPSAEVLRLKQPPVAAPANQEPNGLWIVDEQSLNRIERGGLNLGDAIYVEEGTWRSATKTGKLTKDLVGSTMMNAATKAANGIPVVEIETLRGQVLRGIYRVDGDTMTFATNLSDSDLPCFFTTELTAGSGRAAFVAVLRRVRNP